MKQPLRLLLPALFLIPCLTGGLHAQGLQPQWVHAIPELSNVRMALNAQKTVYLAGLFSGTVDFDPGSGTASLTADTGSGKGSVYLAAYDAAGNYLFAKKIGERGHVYISAITLDPSGNICIAGGFDSTVDLDPGPGVAAFTGTGFGSAFVGRYDAAGNYLNAFMMSGTNITGTETITTDAAGNLYVAGDFAGSTDFDPGPGTLTLTSSGSDDAWLGKYTPAGALTWAFRLTGSQSATSVALDAAGNVYLGGLFPSSVDLDPGPGTAIFTSVGGVDGFIAKYDGGGNYLKGFTMNGGINQVAIDGAGDVYTSGRVTDSMDADPGPGKAMLYSVNFFDVYLAKYDANFNYLQAQAFRSNLTYIEDGIVTDHQNNVYMHGYILDTAYFHPVGTTGMLTSQGGREAFITKFDAAGAYKFGHTFGSMAADELMALAVDGQGGVWVAGYFNGTVDFDPGSGTLNHTGGTKGGMFFGRYLDPASATSVPRTGAPKPAAIYSAGATVVVDFSGPDAPAEVRVINLLGQTVAATQHSGRGQLRLTLPEGPGQVYLVEVRQGAAATRQKVWLQ